ncbi:hypothetical protein WBJ53_18865 [Spirosoma sp. SC4-14]
MATLRPETCLAAILGHKPAYKPLQTIRNFVYSAFCHSAFGRECFRTA